MKILLKMLVGHTLSSIWITVELRAPAVTILEVCWCCLWWYGDDNSCLRYSWATSGDFLHSWSFKMKIAHIVPDNVSGDRIYGWRAMSGYNGFRKDGPNSIMTIPLVTCLRVIYVDNVSSHDAISEETKAQLNKMNTSIRFLVVNQPCDSYVIWKSRTAG